MFSRKRQYVYLSDKFQCEAIDHYDIFMFGENNRAEYVGQVVNEEYARIFIEALKEAEKNATKNENHDDAVLCSKVPEMCKALQDVRDIILDFLAGKAGDYDLQKEAEKINSMMEKIHYD